MKRNELWSGLRAAHPSATLPLAGKMENPFVQAGVPQVQITLFPPLCSAQSGRRYPPSPKLATSGSFSSPGSGALLQDFLDSPTSI